MTEILQALKKNRFQQEHFRGSIAVCTIKMNFKKGNHTNPLIMGGGGGGGGGIKY